MDSIVNAIYDFVREMSNTSFCILMGVIIGLGFLFLSIFLKANKKESAKVAKISKLFWAILCLIVFVVLMNIRG